MVLPLPDNDPDTQYGIARPGHFKATWATPSSGSLMAFAGEWTLELERDAEGAATGYWIAGHTDGIHHFSGRSECAQGAFLTMLADRCGLAATVALRREPGQAAPPLPEGTG